MRFSAPLKPPMLLSRGPGTELVKQVLNHEDYQWVPVTDEDVFPASNERRVDIAWTWVVAPALVLRHHKIAPLPCDVRGYQLDHSGPLHGHAPGLPSVKSSGRSRAAPREKLSPRYQQKQNYYSLPMPPIMYVDQSQPVVQGPALLGYAVEDWNRALVTVSPFLNYRKEKYAEYLGK